MFFFSFNIGKLKYLIYLVLILFLLAVSSNYLADNTCFTSGKLNGWTKLAYFATPVLSTDIGREHNLRTGVAIINNQILEPGNAFSFNQRSGPYTEELGWRNAKNSMVVGSELVDSIGGGVCQITATLYNAALLADLKIEERHPHNITPKYVDPGRDSAVWYEGDLDLVFRNDKDFPIVIKSWVEDKKVQVEIWGKGSEAKKWRENHQVEMQLNKEGEIPYQKVEIKDENLAEGKKYVEINGSYGYNKVTLRRIVKNKDKVEKEEIISVDKYAPLQERLKIGTNKTLETMGSLWFLGKPIRF